MDRTRLSEYGGPTMLTVPWAKSLLKRMNFTKRRVSTKSTDPAGDFEEVKRTFLTEILETVEFYDIPPELIFNWDQTGINLVPTALWTMDRRGKKRIEIAGYQDKRQTTAVMCGSLVGELLPFQLVYMLERLIGVILPINFQVIGKSPTPRITGPTRRPCCNTSEGSLFHLWTINVKT